MRVRRLAAVFAACLALGLELDQPTADAALKEALRVGAKTAVEQTSRTDGFLRNPEIRIPIPDELKPMASGLRGIGLRGQIDEFELALNRSAENAAGEAFEVFSGAIAQLKPADARALLQGGDIAATEYLRQTTLEDLRARFMPIAQRGMRKAGLVPAYERLLEHWRALPQAARPDVELDAYITDKTLEGLFLVLGEQERRIRSDPAARTSDLLRRAFGARSPS